MVVALGTADREAEPHAPRCRHPVEDGVDAKLFLVDPPFFVDLRVAVEAGGDPLLVGGVGEEIAGELMDREAIEGEIAVGGLDDPVAPPPDLTWGVDRIAVAVGIARLIEPQPRLPLAVVRARQEPIDLPFPGLLGIGRMGGKKAIELWGRRREARQVEADAAEKRLGGSRRRRGEPRTCHGSHEKAVDRMLRARHLRRRRLSRRRERPVGLVGGPGRNPVGEDALVAIRKLLSRLRRRHHGARVGALDPGHEPAGGNVAGLNCHMPGVEEGYGPGRLIEAQARLTGARVEAVAGEAVGGEDREDVARVAHGPAGGRSLGNGHRRPENERQERADDDLSLEWPHVSSSRRGDDLGELHRPVFPR